MKPFYQVSVILLFVFAGNLAFAQDFEGVINMTKFEPDTVKASKIYVKGDSVLVKMQTENGEVRVINNRAARMTTSLFQKKGKKYAYIARQAEMKAQPLDERQKMIMELAEKQLKVEETDETRQIGGYTCWKVIGEDQGEWVEAWVTDQIGLSLFDLFPHEQSEESETIDLQKKIWKLGVVLEYWTKDKDSGQINKVTYEPEAQEVSDDEFAYSKEEYYEFDQQTLNSLYTQAANDPQKMQELRELLDAFQSN